MRNVGEVEKTLRHFFLAPSADPAKSFALTKEMLPVLNVLKRPKQRSTSNYFSLEVKGACLRFFFLVCWG